jgi:hypothetical protein
MDLAKTELLLTVIKPYARIVGTPGPVSRVSMLGQSAMLGGVHLLELAH